MAQDQLQSLLHLTRRLREAVLQGVADASAPGHWPELWGQFQRHTGRQEATAFADSVAQAVTCGHYAVTADASHHLTPGARKWLLAQADPLLAQILRLCLTVDELSGVGNALVAASAHIAWYLSARRAAGRLAMWRDGDHVHHAATCFLERLLSQYDSRVRRRQGAYYTPPSIVGFIVRSVDHVLRAEFSLEDGLADGATWHDVQSASAECRTGAPRCRAAPFIRVLDPAMGTGVFLLEVFDHVQRWWTACHAVNGAPAGSPPGNWEDYVADTLLPRLWGQELMLPAVVLAQLLMTARLGESGFRFARPGKLHLYLGNTLCEPRIGDTRLDGEDNPYTVVLGNPPFSGVSENDYRWIRQLLRGCAPGNRGVANYFQVDGQPLGERKHWLEDDYVKFLRLAHWLIESASAGVVGFVTNHGFLDNVTFRGMRQQLLRTFSRVTIVDLHGNKRTGERPPLGGHDESVFGIEQGVAISLWRRPMQGSVVNQIEHTELWGRRAEKLLALAGTQPLTTTRLEPHTPDYFLVPRDRRGESEYARGYRLSDIMPVSSTAAVTARDGFVVAFSTAELRARIAVLCDGRVSDDEIRRRFFTSGRSPKYPPGDTRGWRLADARERLSREADWTCYIRDCLYRPFDRRWIFWTPWMIDWPREAVMTHLVDGDNLAIVARRQVPASHPCNYFWITDTIALDGLIRSDNRGGESVFPLFLVEDKPPDPSLAMTRRTHADQPVCARRANFSADFLARFAEQLRLAWNPSARHGHDDQFTALELFHYIYAVLHAPSYRERFATWLRIDFPRVFVPARLELFRCLSALGSQLVDLHLLRIHRPARVSVAGITRPAQVSPGGPRLVNQRIQVNNNLSIGPVPTDVWEFRVGTHQVCHKWLKDRRGRDLESTDLAHFCQILTSIHDTLACMRQIDREIAAYGGWAAAFA
jgi:hypothetical protein